MKTKTDWAIRNLELAGFFDKDSDYEGAIGEAVKELLLVLQKQGHSGFSHRQTVNLFHRVALGESLTLQHWQEQFEEFAEYAPRDQYGGMITEAEYIELGYPKPAPERSEGDE